MPKQVTDQPNGNTLKPVIREAVQEELKPIRVKIQPLREEVTAVKDDLERHFDEKLEEKINDSFVKFRDEIFTMLDEVMGELKTMREEFTVHQGQHDDIAERVEKLEAIHPWGEHPQ